MNKKGKRITLVLFLSLLCAALSSCGIVQTHNISEQSYEKSTLLTTSHSISTPEAPNGREEEDDGAYNPETQLSYLPDDNFSSDYFTVLVLKDDSVLFPDETQYISASAYERNRKVEEKYNIKIVEKAMTEQALGEFAESSELAGSYYADLISLPNRCVNAFYEKGLIEDFNTKPFYVQDKPYFDTEITEKLNEGYDGVYALYCDTLRLPDDMYCLFYNKAHAGANEISTLSANLNREDFVSLAQKHGAVSNISENYFDGLFEIYSEEGKDAHTIFLEGKAAFCIDKISSIEKLSSLCKTLGLIALPVFEDGVYGSISDINEMRVFCYPSNATSDKRTVLVASALGAAGCNENMKAATAHYLEYVQDNSSAFMLHKIFSEYKLVE